MNKLIVGRDTSSLLDTVPDAFLLIDDGSIIDRLELPPRRKVVNFDVSKHAFNPLKGMNYLRARGLITVLDAVFPEGESTLTKKGANFVLLKALLDNPKRLDTLLKPNPDDNAHTDAYQKLQTLVLSPVLKNVLCSPTNFPFTGTILARLNRAELGDFDCFVLGNLLIQQYQGQVIIPDFGFYCSIGHSALIRQNRLMAGVTTLDDVPKKIRQLLLMIEDKVGKHCTADDAETLALYAGISPATNKFTDFVQKAID